MSPDKISELRPSFVPAIPALDEAATLLSRAADALISGDNELACVFLREADMPVLHEHATRIMGKLNDEIHRYRPIKGTPHPSTPDARGKRRMPSASVQDAVYERDGYRCRYCGCRVVLKAVRTAMKAIVPSGINWPSDSDKGKHGAFLALQACVDHLVPREKGGDDDPGNLVTACWPCNFGKMNYLIEELSLADPRSRPPVCDEWDGLARAVKKLNSLARSKAKQMGAVSQKSYGKEKKSVKKSTLARVAQDEWFSQLDHIYGHTASARLIALLQTCEDIDVSWNLNLALIVSMKTKDVTLQIFGIEANGHVEIPWSITGEKEKFKQFAESLANAIPEAVAYETPKMWRVKMPNRRVNIKELLDAPAAVRQALENLHAALVH